VRIDAIERLDWRGEGRDHPELEVAIACGPGTYIRSIARDLGQKLGVGATLTTLIRTASCGFHLNQSLSFEQIEQQLESQSFQPISFNQALKNVECLTFGEAYTQRWYFGQRLPIDRSTITTPVSADAAESIPIFVKTEDDIPLGIGLWTAGVLSPKIVLPEGDLS